MTAREKNLMYLKIVERAEKLGINQISRLTGIMDIEFADKKFNLRLLDFLTADDINFTHDYTGIQNNIDRSTKEFGFFVPRFAGGSNDK